MSLRSELIELQRTAKDGILHASRVVDWARMNTKSSLHQAIEWSDDIAAREYRLSQARQLIQLHIRDDRGQPLLVSLSIDRTGGGGYRPISDVVTVPDLREIMVRDALEDLERVRRRYDRIVELAEVWQAADRAKAATGGKRKRKEAAQPAEQPAV